MRAIRAISKELSSFSRNCDAPLLISPLRHILESLYKKIVISKRYTSKITILYTFLQNAFVRHLFFYLLFDDIICIIILDTEAVF